MDLRELPDDDRLVSCAGRIYKVKARSARNRVTHTSFIVRHSEPSFDYLVGVTFTVGTTDVAWAVRVSRAEFEGIAYFNADSTRLRLSRRGGERHRVEWLKPKSDPYGNG